MPFGDVCSARTTATRLRPSTPEVAVASQGRVGPERDPGVPMTARARCLWASQPAVLTDTNRTSGSSKSAQEPVVKSCSLVPTASTTSARAATALAANEPVMPIGPA